MSEFRIAVIVGILQGLFEWLPISSEGNIALYLTAVEELGPTAATEFALFLHVGTAVSASLYYRDELAALARRVPRWRTTRDGELTFLTAATLASAAVGLAAYATIEELFSALTGGAFIVLIGVLLVATGLFQRVANTRLGSRTEPTLADGLLVGALQGLAILPGISRSGSTVSVLLLRGYDSEASFRLSFLLSIPAALGAGVLTLADGVPELSLAAGAVAAGVAAVVGYLSIDALLRVVARVAFWAVCLGLGGLAVVGGVVTIL